MASRSALTLVALASTAAAFTPLAPSATRSSVRVADAVTEPEVPTPVEPEAPPAPIVNMINGWAPDAAQPIRCRAILA